MDIRNTLPAWARPTLEALAAHRKMGTLKPSALDKHDVSELRAVDWVVDRYKSYDENPAIDKAMHQPGKVVTSSSTLCYDQQGKGNLEASLLGSDRHGHPVALWMQRHPGSIEAYSVEDLGKLYYVQGGRLDLDASGGFYLAGALPRPSNESSAVSRCPSPSQTHGPC